MYRSVVIILLLAAAVGVTFRLVPSADFVAWDDESLLYHNPLLNPVTGHHLAYVWQHPYLQLYMPLTYSAWSLLALEARLRAPRLTSGAYPITLSPLPFHAASLILHCLNAALVFLVVRHLLARHHPDREAQWRDLSAALGAGLFALHPLQVESVAWASELKGVLSGCFGLLAVWVHLTTQSDAAGPDAPASDSSRRRLHRVLALACFVLALLAKPSAVCLPLVVFILDSADRGWRQVARDVWPWLLVAVLWTVVTWLCQPVANEVWAPLGARPMVALDAIAWYVERLIAPVGLGIDYGRTPQVAVHSGQVPAAMGLCALVALLWFAARRRQGTTGWAWLAAAGVFLAVLTPVLGLVPFAFQQYSTVADRYAYLAMLGPALGLAWLVDSRPPRERSGWLLAGALLLAACSLRSTRQTRYWNSSIPLYTRSLQVNPQSWLCWTSLGVLLDAQGRLPDSLRMFHRALAVKPDYADAYYALGKVQLSHGQSDAALANFQRTVHLNPRQAEAHYNLGVLLVRQGKQAEAQDQFATALRLNPLDARAHNNLGMVLARQGRLAEAMPHWRQALDIDPTDSSAHYNLGLALLRQGDRSAAVDEFQAALRGNPGYASAVRGLRAARGQ